MILIPCIHCGPRNASEFAYLGELGRQPDPNTTTPPEWRRYLYTKANTAGWTVERWVHRAGCGRFFTVERNTLDNKIRTARPPDAQIRLIQQAARADPKADA